jgi:hypothetical protein
MYGINRSRTPVASNTAFEIAEGRTELGPSFERLFWFWMWGVPGAILSVPMLAITKIVATASSL